MNQAKVTKLIDLTHNVFEIEFKTEESFNFKAGQFITIKIEDEIKPCFRAYSIASAPQDENNNFSLCIKRIEKGRGSNWIGNLNKKDIINFMGPNGDFICKNKKSELLYIATGTGIAPFHSIITDLLEKNHKSNITLLFGVRHEKDLFYTKYFTELEQKNTNFKFITTLSRPENKNWKGNTGRVTTILKNMEIEKDINTYICGLTPMIESVEKILKEKGLKNHQIHFEKYD